MGRKALYATEQERREAKKERERMQGSTQRGKQQRAAQNRRAYERRKGPVPMTLRLPYISRYVEPLANPEMDITSDILLAQFNGGLSFTGGSDDNDNEFTHWDQPPPYQVSSSLLDVGLDDTINALHGRRMRLQHLAELNIVQQYEESGDLDEVWRFVHRDLVHRLTAFTKLRRTVQLYKHESRVDYEMGMHLLQWRAHAIMALKTYWLALKDRKQGSVRQIYESKWESL